MTFILTFFLCWLLVSDERRVKKGIADDETRELSHAADDTSGRGLANDRAEMPVISSMATATSRCGLAFPAKIQERAGSEIAKSRANDRCERFCAVSHARSCRRPSIDGEVMRNETARQGKTQGWFKYL